MVRIAVRSDLSVHDSIYKRVWDRVPRPADRVLKLDEYAPQQSRRPDELQQVLFPYMEAI